MQSSNELDGPPLIGAFCICKMKKSFILHIDSLSILDELSDEQAGKLFKAIHNYQTGVEAELDMITKIAFASFKAQFIRDDEQYNNVCDGKSLRGKIGNLKRWHPDLFTQLLEDHSNIDELIEIAKHRSSDISESQTSLSIPKSLKSDSKSDNDSNSDSNKENNNKRDWESFIRSWNRLTERNIRVVTDKAKRQIEKVLKTYTQAEFWATVENCKSDPYHIENPQYLTPEFISREDKFQKYYQKKQVTLRKDWFNTPNLPPEEWALLTPEQQKNKKLNDIRNGY